MPFRKKQSTVAKKRSKSKARPVKKRKRAVVRAVEKSTDRIKKVIRNTKEIVSDVGPFIYRAAKHLGIPLIGIGASALYGPQASQISKVALGFLLDETTNLVKKVVAPDINKEIEKTAKDTDMFRPPEEEIVFSKGGVNHVMVQDQIRAKNAPREIQDQMRLKRIHGSSYIPQLPSVNKRLLLKHAVDTRTYKAVVDPELELTL